MKNPKTIIIAALLLATSNITNAQSIGINTDGSPPNSSAMLDVSSSSKGFLVPRMTSEKMNAIVDPASGLMVFCTDCGSGSMAIFIEDTWNLFNITCLNPIAPVSGTHITGSTEIVWNWSSGSGNDFRYKWNTTNDYASAIDMETSTSKTEINLICNTSYTRYVWAYNSCGASAPLTLTQSTAATPPSSFTEGIHVLSGTQIVWNWTASAGANGYKWNTANDFSTATDLGNVLTKTETGLSVGTTYTRYVWAYSDCGESLITLNQILFFIGADYGGGKVAYILQSGDPGFIEGELHGFIAAPSDIPGGSFNVHVWGCNGTAIPGADGLALGTGSQNTSDIVAGCAEATIAARLCSDLILNGYDDWYLPSLNELLKLVENSAAIGGFWQSAYASSSEYSADKIWYHNFYYSNTGQTGKHISLRVRAIRSF